MIQSIIPKLPFIDKQKTIDFYLKLGFKTTSDYGEYGEYGEYVIIENQSIELHLFSFLNLIPEKSDFMIYLRVSFIDELYKNYIKNGILIHPNGKLVTKPWNQKEFAVVDPNGTLLTFGQNI